MSGTSIAVRRVRALLVAFALGAALMGVVGTATASADVVQGQSDGTWIWVGTGAKNYTNHTQWVSYVTVYTGSNCPSKLEAWTSGFYATQTVCGPHAVTWYISRWVASGNAVCGASSNHWGRGVACIGIRV